MAQPRTLSHYSDRSLRDWDVSQRSKIAITSETLHNHKISRADLSAYISHSPQPTPTLQWRTKAFPLLCCRRREAFVMSNTCHTVSPSITPISNWLFDCHLANAVSRPFQNSTGRVHPTITTKLKITTSQSIFMHFFCCNLLRILYFVAQLHRIALGRT